MSKYIIEGGKRLIGNIKAESAKNAVLPIIAGTLLIEDKVIIEKYPKIKDVFNMIEIIKGLGVKVEFEGENLLIDSSSLKTSILFEDLSKKLRSSFFLLGPLLSRTKKATVFYPGGCKIGKRPIDIHVESLKKLGVKIEEKEDQINCTVEKLKNVNISLRYPSVGATENLILFLAVSNLDVVISNVAKEPEVEDLINFLNLAGAKIYGAGTDKLRIIGVKKLGGLTYKPIFDRIEVGTYMIAVALTGGEIEISNVNAKKITSLLNKFYNSTCKIGIKDDIMYLSCNKPFKGFFIETNPYPYFPTDLQAQMSVLAVKAKGCSKIKENVFESRFGYVPELLKMGADIKIDKNVLLINGKDKLFASSVKACDLRGGAALTLAGLSAEGVSEILDVYHVERGYVDFHGKLQKLGAKIERVE